MRTGTVVTIAVIILMFLGVVLAWSYLREHPMYIGSIKFAGDWLVYDAGYNAYFVVISNGTHKVIGPTSTLYIKLNKSAIKLEVWWSGRVRYEYLIYYDFDKERYDFYWWYEK